MSQTNEDCHTWADEIYRRQVGFNNTCRYPSNWDTSIQTTSHRLVEVSKHRHQGEYKKVQKLFNMTFPEGNITKLERVQNYNCWATYARQKEVMINKNCFDERQLFHGTKEENVEDICRDGFDFRLSGTRHGAAYGQGAYFARKAKYSNDYAEANICNMKKMFVARALVGVYTLGTRDMRRPPYKDLLDRTKGMYDTCVDNISNPNIFVIFDNHQVYPEYLITYSTSSANQVSYSSSNQQFLRSFVGGVCGAILRAYNSSNRRSSNTYNPRPTRQSRSALGANQISTSSSNQQSSDPYNPRPIRQVTSSVPVANQPSNQLSRNPSTPLPTTQSSRSVTSVNQTSHNSSNPQTLITLGLSFSQLELRLVPIRHHTLVAPNNHLTLTPGHSYRQL
ncbi:protein mono-ADP-ribosyltransferase PARP11-like [Anneissia japonica]|uniref:protein mono-ADP-ribosyltransferase PARP11-like n=1 Tax=Anneissia japonica TaxID=1529436 RepID=UPI00142564F2|nr:protein mono-ADP-ribosyltransferase PARP11-like [Anneissia japonica]